MINPEQIARLIDRPNFAQQDATTLRYMLETVFQTPDFQRAYNVSRQYVQMEKMAQTPDVQQQRYELLTEWGNYRGIVTSNFPLTIWRTREDYHISHHDIVTSAPVWRGFFTSLSGSLTGVHLIHLDPGKRNRLLYDSVINKNIQTHLPLVLNLLLSWAPFNSEGTSGISGSGGVLKEKILLIANTDFSLEHMIGIHHPYTPSQVAPTFSNPVCESKLPWDVGFDLLY